MLNEVNLVIIVVFLAVIGLLEKASIVQIGLEYYSS